MRRNIFITGGTGYVGRHLIPRLLERGHTVRALVREGSEGKLPEGCTALLGNALDKDSFAHLISPSDTLLHLVGVPRPSPVKAKEFRAIDLVSIRASVPAAVEARVEHFVYVSVAQPAPIMRAYIEVRAEGERLIGESGLRSATILRPWYVLGPGHYWPYVLLPVYWLLERLPSTAESAKRLGLLTIEQMVRALINAIENPAPSVKIMDVQEMKSLAVGNSREKT
ncbi:MAG: NAD(P)H-binding protein, partial [Pyrinomonadaceae bacterium]|nr:NAD(P)H-binding protein [Pyrinomonadaceae bacterium]